MEPRSQIFPTIICGVEVIDEPGFHQYPTAGRIISCAREFGCSHWGAILVRYGRPNCGPKRVLHEPQLRFVIRCSGILQEHHGWTRFSISGPITVTLRNLFETSKVSSVPVGKGDYHDTSAGPGHSIIIQFRVWHPRASSSSVTCPIYSTVPIRRRRWR